MDDSFEIPALELRISNLAGPLCTIGADQSWKLHNLKMAVQTATGILPECQRLLFNFMPFCEADELLVSILPSSGADLMLIRIEEPFCTLRAPHFTAVSLSESNMMTLEDAKLKCRNEPHCQGFTYQYLWQYDGEPEGPVKIEFLSRDGFSFNLHGSGFDHRRRDERLVLFLDTEKDRELVLNVFREYSDVLHQVMDREIICTAIQENPSAMQHVCLGLRADLDIVLGAVQLRGEVLQYASDLLRCNRVVVMAAVQQNPHALKYASPDLQADKDIVSAAMQVNMKALRFASEELRSDREFVLPAIQKNGHLLAYVSAKLQADREVVLAAVQHQGLALQYASKELKADPEVIRLALQQDPCSRRYVSDFFFQNSRFKKAKAAAEAQGWVAVETGEKMVEIEDCKAPTDRVAWDGEDVDVLAMIGSPG